MSEGNGDWETIITVKIYPGDRDVKYQLEESFYEAFLLPFWHFIDYSAEIGIASFKFKI